jgi:quercetin dioxygenase-like cupin family protein
MHKRDENLQIIVDHSRAHISTLGDRWCRGAADRVFECLDKSTGDQSSVRGEYLPVCRHLEAAYAGMTTGASPLPEIGRAFSALEGRLSWWRRKGISAEDQPFYDGHANAMLIGPGGLEQREDVMVGVSLMAPGIVYPDHSHPPEEVYLAFTDGEWWNAEMDWTRPGPGGLIYNPPGILHAMRSGGTAFLALWLLPVSGTSA